MSATDRITASTQRLYEVTQQDLPLSCPMPNMAVWNSHPRVFLPIEQSATRRAICPYCSAEFILKETK